jgi:hypothetical protein
MGTYSLLVRDTDYIHQHVVHRAKILRRSFTILRRSTENENSEQLVFIHIRDEFLNCLH